MGRSIERLEMKKKKKALKYSKTAWVNKAKNDTLCPTSLEISRSFKLSNVSISYKIVIV